MGRWHTLKENKLSLLVTIKCQWLTVGTSCSPFLSGLGFGFESQPFSVEWYAAVSSEIVKQLWSGYVGQLSDLPSIGEALGSIPSTTQNQVWWCMYAYNPSTHRMEAVGSEIQDRPLLQTKSEASLGCVHQHKCKIIMIQANARA